MRSLVSVLIGIALLLPLQTRGQTNLVQGQWKWEGSDSDREILLEFRVDKTKVTGTISMGRYTIRGFQASGKRTREMLVFKLRDIRQDGNTISFEQEMPYVPVRNKNFAVLYRGAVDTDRMTLTRTVREMSIARIDSPAATFTMRRVARNDSQ